MRFGNTSLVLLNVTKLSCLHVFTERAQTYFVVLDDTKVPEDINWGDCCKASQALFDAGAFFDTSKWRSAIGLDEGTERAMRQLVYADFVHEHRMPSNTHLLDRCTYS